MRTISNKNYNEVMRVLEWAQGCPTETTREANTRRLARLLLRKLRK